MRTKKSRALPKKKKGCKLKKSRTFKNDKRSKTLDKE